MDYLKRAHELAEEIVANRRYLHQHPETGLDVPVTKAYVEEKLTEMGYQVQHVGPGLVAMAGSGNPVVLLRADMDALPMEEESGLPFASLTPGKAHCCGHDNHTAMLLGAARLLKENEANLKGTVKLMFQPGEEVGKGAFAMVEAGVLENPKPDAAMAFHVDAATPLGIFHYGKGATFCSSDVFTIEVFGKAGHGARPHQAIDSITAAAHIVTALEALIAREATPTETNMLTICSIESDTKVFNVFPTQVTMTGSLRSYSQEQRDLLLQRMEETVEGIAKTFRCTSKITYGSQFGTLVVNDALEDEMRGYLEEALGGEATVVDPPIVKMGSEDFAGVTAHVPSAFFFVGAGPDRENGYFCTQHNSKVRFNEEMLPWGAAGFAHCATKWLENHSK